MSDPYELKETTKLRVAKHARPFVDTFDSVINRIIDIYEQMNGPGPDNTQQAGLEIKDFDPATPPNLTHTKVLSITFNGTGFSPEATTWNALLLEAIRAARKKIQSDEELRGVIPVNFVFGRKETDGYRYLKDADLSVQGQDSNGAWVGTFHIARRLGFTFDVIFAWREKEGSANPGIKGRFRRGKLHTLI
jgi:hypothetical protein